MYAIKILYQNLWRVFFLMCFLFQSVASPPTLSPKSGSSFSLNPLHIPSTPTPPSNLETLWRDGLRSFHCASPGLKGGAGGPTCQGQPSRGWEAGLPQQHAWGGKYLQGGFGGEAWSSEFWAGIGNAGGWLQELQGKKLLLCTLVIPKLLSPHFIPSPSHPPDGTCTTLRVKNLSPRITKNWLWHLMAV